VTVLDVLNSPWAITPDKYAQIRDIYVRHLNGEPVNLKAIEAELGRPLDNKRPENYEIVSGVAVIPVVGVIAQRMNLFAAISGGTSTQALAKDFADAMARTEVNSILLVIDSPGGEVNGTQELANDVFAARGVKPVVALCEGVMCSAAYWIGSAADEM
jgi:ClpP class serine protease